jgi:hypothetical protein
VRVAEARTVDIGGTTCGRVTLDGSVRDFAVRFLMYVMPGEKFTAVLVYTTRDFRFDAAYAVFDASAKATRGIKPPGLKYRFMHGPWNDKTHLAAAAVVLLVVLLIVAKLRRASA